MKDKSKMIELFKCLSIILLYYISGKSSLFLYATTLSLYNIYLSCFSHISLKETFKKSNNNYSKFKILKYTSIIIISICLLFIITSILLSDTINILLNIKNTFIPYLIMSITVFTEPLLKIFLEYLESYDKPKLANRLLNTYYIIETIFLILIGLFSMTIFKAPIHIAISLLYISKIISFILVSIITLIVLNKQNINFDKQQDEKNTNYNQFIKEILKNNSHKSLIDVVKKSYYYVSIIILYAILSTRYSYDVTEIENSITFIYLYGITIINFIVTLVLNLVKTQDNKNNIVNRILKVFNFMSTTAIFLGVTSPLISIIIFGDNTNSIYLTILSFLSIFIALYDITYDNIKNKKIIYASLIIGTVSKMILVVPLINSIYRMGYNIIYGDIISTMISMFVSIMINSVYIATKNKNVNPLDKVLKILYESIILSIILVILQFIIPIKTTNYIKSIFIFGIYLFVTIMFLKIKKKKRG